MATNFSKKNAKNLQCLSSSAEMESVQVVVRCRPMNEKELAVGFHSVIHIDAERGAIDIRNPSAENDSQNQIKVFTFDAVYGWNSSTSDLYEETIRPLISSLLHGFNGTIFAYGQTGAGKTYTMEGDKSSPKHKGLIPMSFTQIFDEISRSCNMQYLVMASYLEIYQEEIRDLLVAEVKHLDLKERHDKSVYVKGLSTVVCRSSNEIENLMSIGRANRMIGTTDMNEKSSRSHAIFTITIEMTTTGNNANKSFKCGKLNLVDLAGSERQSKTGAKGDRLKESSGINLSLSALGNVISALVDGTSKHIPYRDSKLTRLLQDSLGGNSKTIMVANIGPANYNYKETLTTLRYANRAKNIKNVPRINEDPKNAQIRQYEIEIVRLKKQLFDSMQSRTILEAQRRNKLDLESCDISSTERIDKRTKDDSKIQGKRHKCNQEDKELEDLMLEEKQQTKELEEKISALESKLLCGGKNIIDHTNEQQRALELQNQAIAEQKKKEILLKQKLEMQEESAIGIRDTYTNLQQEVQFKTNKLKRLFSKLQTIKQEIEDASDDFNSDRRDIEIHHHALLKEIKLRYLLIENFISFEDRMKYMDKVIYDEESDSWINKHTEYERIKLCRHVATNEEENHFKTVSNESEIGFQASKHFQGENIIFVELDKPSRTTQSYEGPLIAPRIRAVLDEALRDEGDLDIYVDASAIHSQHTANSRYVKKEILPSSKLSSDRRISSQLSTTIFPKARGLVRK